MAAVVERMNTGTAVLVGAAFGLGLYVLNFYGMTAAFPWFATARNWVSIFSHVVFGLVAAASYKQLAGPAPVAHTTV